MEQSEQRDREIEALRERLSRLSQASLRINDSLDFDQVLQGALDLARSLTSARYGVMTLLDGEGGVQNFLSSGLTTALADARGTGCIPGLDQHLRTPEGPRLNETRPCPGLLRVHNPLAGGGLPLHGGAHVPPGGTGGPRLRG